jgi:spore coat polysaccharide biosynthesis protein SpsF
MEALKPIPADLYAILCPADSMSILEPLAEETGFSIMAGPKEDVLARYAKAVKTWNISTVVRATGDNPLVSAELAASLIPLHHETGADYSGYLGIPVGAGVEIIRSDSLLRADKEAKDPYDREHVAPYLYRNPGLFAVNRPEPADTCYRSGVRITLDTMDDYTRLVRIFGDLWTGSPIPLDQAIGWMDKCS